MSEVKNQQGEEEQRKDDLLLMNMERESEEAQRNIEESHQKLPAVGGFVQVEQ